MFEIKDPTINQQEIDRVIKDQIEQRRQYAQARHLDFEALVQSYSLEEEVKRLNLMLVEHHKANILIKPYKISADQSWWGYWLSWIRQQAHNLVIYYVNMSGKKQIAFNESVAQTIRIQQAHTEQLQETMISLEKRVQALEAVIKTTGEEGHES